MFQYIEYERKRKNDAFCFRGSDCRRSSSSTWYNRMDNLLMALGFTESKEDPNLFFKVEGRKPVMLLLYVMTNY